MPNPLPIKIVIRKYIQERVPINELRDYFLAWNVDIEFQEGEELPFDPLWDPKDIDDLLRQHAPPAKSQLPWPALLLICSHFKDDSGTNGILLDAKSRGMSAICARSYNFITGSAEARFEIYVHEIGHLLNLIHPEADEDYPTAMNQWERRSINSNRAEAWKSAIINADYADQGRLAALFDSGNKTPIGLPFSRKSASYLSDHNPVQKILPWGIEFRDGDAIGVFDYAETGLIMKIELSKDKVHVGEPLDFRLDIQNTKATVSQAIPSGIGLKYGNMVIRLKDEHGRIHSCQGKSMCCGSTSLMLQPGEIISRHFSLCTDRTRILFDRPGEYNLEVSVPSLGLHSPDQKITVTRSLNSLLDEPLFQEFLVNNLPKNQSRHWKALNSAIDDPAISVSLRCHLAELQFSKRPYSKKNNQLPKLISELGASSRRIKERVLLINLARAYKSKQTSTDRLSRLLDKTKNDFSQGDPKHPTINYLNYFESLL